MLWLDRSTPRLKHVYDLQALSILLLLVALVSAGLTFCQNTGLMIPVVAKVMTVACGAGAIMCLILAKQIRRTAGGTQ